MLKSILNLKGTQQLTTLQQSRINGGLVDCKEGQTSTRENPCRRRLVPSNGYA